MDPVQLVIILISLIITILVVVLGVQVWHILKEMRRSLQKVNSMLDDMTKVTHTVGQGATQLGGIVSGIKAGLSIFSSLRGKEENEQRG